MPSKQLSFVVLCIAFFVASAFLPPKQQISTLVRNVKTSSTLQVSNADRSFLYRDEPTDLERQEIKREAGKTKHSTFHVEKGPEYVDDKFDPMHTLHHHLIDVDHEKLADLELRAQNAWKPVEVHEVDVDPVTVASMLFVSTVLVLFLFGQTDGAGISGFVARLSNTFKG